MAAAPQYATFIFIGRRTGEAYVVDAYLSDVANALVNWDSGVGASSTSEQEWIAPELVTLSDFSIPTGMTDTTKIQLNRNGVSTGKYIRFANHLNTLNNRPYLGTSYAAGHKVSAIQLA